MIMEPSNPPTFYVGRGAFLASQGKWTVSVDLRRNRGNDLALPFVVNLRDAGTLQPASRSGGAFAAPVAFSLASVVLVGGSAVIAVGLIAGSRTREGLPTGYVGLAVENVSERLSGLRPAWSIAALVFLGIGLGWLVGSHAHPQVTEEEAVRGNPVESSPESIQRGQMLFFQNCTLCHGESGRGDGPAARTLPIPPANLYDHIPYHPDQFFYSVITNGLSGIMPAFGNQLSDEDRWHILNFLRDRFGQPPPES
jgi:mono/diheme cytochrome c family protein